MSNYFLLDCPVPEMSCTQPCFRMSSVNEKKNEIKLKCFKILIIFYGFLCKSNCTL